MTASIFRVTAGPDDPAARRGHMVLVHGSMDRSAGMLKLSRELDREWRVTRYDRRGYGRSRPTDGPFTVAAHIADLHSVVLAERDRSEPVVLVAHSFGGNVALGLAAGYPELVRAVVVYESPLWWFEWYPTDDTPAVRLMRAVSDPAEVGERFMRYAIGDARWEALPASTRAARRAEGEAMVGEWSDLRDHAPWEAEHLRLPVLAISGEHGPLHHHQGMEALEAMLPDARRVVLEGAGHYGPNTHPREVAELVRGFLATLPTE